MSSLIAAISLCDVGREEVYLSRFRLLPFERTTTAILRLHIIPSDSGQPAGPSSGEYYGENG
jgi:hypothetical protein